MAPDRPRGARDDVLDVGFGLLCLAIFAWSWVGFTLAEAGLFRPWLLLPAGVIASVAAVVAGWRGAARPVSGCGWRALASLAACVVLSAALYSRPGDYLVDGADGSMYLGIGAALVDHGSLTFSEPMLDLVDHQDWPAVLTPARGQLPYYDVFPGGLQTEQAANLVHPGFFHLFPVWLGTSTLAVGPGADLWVSPIFGMLSVVSLWMLARRLGGVAVATFAAGLLGVSYAEIWAARFPGSEVLTQFLLLSALYFAVRWSDQPSRTAAFGMGTAFGLAACTRIDVLLAVSPVVVGYLLLVRRGPHRLGAWWLAALPVLFLTTQAIAHAFVVATPYTLRILEFAFDGQTVGYWALALPPVVVVLGVAAWLLHSRSGIGIVRRWVLRGAVLAVVALGAVRVAPEAAAGLLGTVVTPVGVMLAVIGLVWLLVDDRRPVSLVLAAVFGVSVLVYAETPGDRVMMPMLLRRFVPVIVPMTALFVAYAIGRVHARAGRWRPAVLIVAASMAALHVSRSQPLLAEAGLQGVERQMAAVADRFGDDALIITDATTPSHFGVSLRYRFGRGVLFVRSTDGTAGVLVTLVSEMARRDRPVFLAVGRSPVDSADLDGNDFRGLRLTPAGSVTLRLRDLVPSPDRLPSDFRDLAPVIEFHRLSAAGPVPLPLDLDIGDYDVGWRVDGFHGWEAVYGVASRWTGAEATLLLPQVSAVPDRSVLVLELAAPRPVGLAPPEVRIELDGRLVGPPVTVAQGFQAFELPLEPWARARLTAGLARLVLRTSTFVPAESGGSLDRRELGVVVDRIRVEPR